MTESKKTNTEKAKKVVRIALPKVRTLKNTDAARKVLGGLKGGINTVSCISCQALVDKCS